MLPWRIADRIMQGLSRHRLASAAGVILALAFPFVSLRLPSWFDDLHPEIGSIAVKLAIAAVLAGIGFGVRHRSLRFYHVQRFGWRDVAATLIATVAAYLAAGLVMTFLESSGNMPDMSDADEIPLAIGVASALVSGIVEEIIYRAYIIEELGELLRSRKLAAAISIVGFAIGHAGTDYGWTNALLVPGVIGLVLTILYFDRKNLLLCILMHTTIDLLFVLAHRG